MTDPLPTTQPTPTEATSETKAPDRKTPRGRKKRKKLVSHGHAYILASYNNTIVTLTDPAGNVLAWASSGLAGFRGPKKSTPYAAGAVVRNVAEKVKEVGLRSVDVFMRGIGSGREAAVRALNANGIAVQTIKDITPTPHNGCRPRKVRRV